MTNSGESALEHYQAIFQAASQTVQKPWVIPAPKGNVQRVFGTSQVFHVSKETRPKVAGVSVPFKVREYYYRGQRCLQQEDWELAVLFCSRALHLDSELVDFYALRAEAYIQLCDFSSAAQNLRRAYSAQPENAVYLERLTFVLYLQGQCLYEQCDFLDALNIFSQASELQPEKPCFRYRCMACLLALKRHHDCLNLATKEVQQGTSNADVYVLRARLYNSFQKPSLCYRDLHSALLLNPKHVQAKLLLKTMVQQAQQARQDAGILAVQGKLQHALLCISCAIENNPLDPSFFLFRGTMYRRLGQFDAAVEDFLKALDMVPSSLQDVVRPAQRQLLLTYNDFAVHCYMQGAYQEGVLLLNKALKDEQQEKGLYINRGDCFFQLGNLTFAEADYQQALALSPEDEGANMRMGLLQEKLGFCEQRRRQFQKAEDHFSAAIQHNPQQAQYYLYRAKSRQLLQDVFGARQDLATALLLNPKLPKLVPMMTNLFPGMSMEDVLGSQIGHLAKMQLERLVESSQQPSSLQGIVGLLRVRELERQKAQALSLSWMRERSLAATAEEPKAVPEDLKVEPPRTVEEAKGPEEEKATEERAEPATHKVPSMSESYVGQTSSSSVLGFSTASTSETETPTLGREYQSSSSTAAASAESSVPKTQSSESGQDQKAQSPSPGPGPGGTQAGQGRSSGTAAATQGQGRSTSKAKTTQGQGRSTSKAKTTQGQGRSTSKAKTTQGPGGSSRKVKATQRQGGSTRKTEATQRQGQGGSASRTEATQGQGQDQAQGESASKTEAAQAQGESTQHPRRRFRRAKAAHGRSWRPIPAEGQGRGLMRSSCKAEALQDPGWSSGETPVTQGQGQQPSRTEAAASWSPSTSSSSSKAKVIGDLIPNLSNTKTTEGASPREAGQEPGVTLLPERPSDAPEAH
ncbi:tetratricopeptide repeat protein 16 isoform X2 [Oryctolagus cuniculus]|uniref:tetratricopeptide repeat protein 16 isoform X2 n=1 Tax=Oryctolagus cuniculus TaxID=9986 RepID=UPI0038795C95